MRPVHALLLIALAAPATAPAQVPVESILGREAQLSLADALSLALENNLNLIVARSEPAISAERLRQSEGVFDPRLSAGHTFAANETPQASRVESFFAVGGPLTGTTIDILDIREEDAWNYTAGMSGILPFGLQYNSAYDITRLESTSGFFVLEPQWTASWRNELTLPLLRDLFDNEASVAVRRSRLAREISQEDFRRLLTDEVQSVEAAYWELAASIEGLRIAQKSLETASSLLEQTRVQYEVGVVSRVAVTQAVAGEAEREVNLIRAQNRFDRAQDLLLNAVAAPDLSGYAGTSIVPEQPTYIEFAVDLDAAVRRAMELRPELGAARRRVEDAEAQLELARNQRLPTFDLVASYTMNGLSGSLRNRDTMPPNPTPPPPTLTLVPPPESSRDAHRTFFGDGAHSWSVGALFEIPFPNTTARAEAVQRKIELRRTRTELRREEQRIVLETRDAARNLASAIEGIQAEERRRDAGAEALRAEQEKLRLGDSTPHDVLEFEEQLAEAENGLTAALQLYSNAVTALERAQGTLLRSRGISVDSELQR